MAPGTTAWPWAWRAAMRCCALLGPPRRTSSGPCPCRPPRCCLRCLLLLRRRSQWLETESLSCTVGSDPRPHSTDCDIHESVHVKAVAWCGQEARQFCAVVLCKQRPQGHAAAGCHAMCRPACRRAGTRSSLLIILSILLAVIPSLPRLARMAGLACQAQQGICLLFTAEGSAASAHKTACTQQAACREALHANRRRARLRPAAELAPV